MKLVYSFISEEEQDLSAKFLEQGYVIQKVDQLEVLQTMRHRLVEIACEHLKLKVPEEDEYFLNTIHQKLPVPQLNDLRVFTYQRINAESWFRPTYFSLGKRGIDALVGNELAMQNRVNLSIQMPEDNSSVLGIHSDIFGAETPFSVILWIPLVNAWETKSMYILPPEANRQVLPKLKEMTKEGGTEKLFETVKKDLRWITVKYGEVLVFSPILFHGNVLNETDETRWSLNCRFTELFTPYLTEEQNVGGFYLPITTKVVSRVGMNYQLPSGFDD